MQLVIQIRFQIVSDLSYIIIEITISTYFD